MYIDDNMKSEIRTAWRACLVTAVLMELFWFCWYLVAGHIPYAELPVLGRVSRVWDFLIGPVFLGFIFLLRGFDDGTNDCFVTNFVGTLVTGLGWAIAICAFFEFGVFGALLVFIITIPAIISVFIFMGICTGVGWFLSKTFLW